MQNRLLLTPALCCVIAGPAALASARPAPAAFTLRTDVRTYLAARRPGGADWSAYEVRVIAQFRNASRQTVYLARCRPESAHPTVDMQPAGSNTPSSRYTVICAGIGHDRQFAVASGATRTDTLTLAWPGEMNGVTQRPWGTPEGRFRLVYFVQDAPGDCVSRKEPVRSGVFVVRVVP